MPNPPLQIYPQGLLGFFQQKAGRNPGPLNEGLQPELELREWYLSSEAEALQDTPQLVNTTGNWGTALVVPNSEFWFLHHIALSGVLEAAEVIEMVPGVTFPGAGIMFPFSPTSGTTRNATPPVATGVSVGAQPRVWLPPLASIFINVIALTTANNVPVTTAVRITRLPM